MLEIIWKKEGKEIKLLFYLLITFTILLSFTGGIFNLYVKSENGGRMPVITDDLNISTVRHFSVPSQNISSVNFYYLSDLFYFSDVYFSVGDVMILFGFFSGIIINIFLEISYIQYKLNQWKQKKQKKQKKTFK